MKGFLQWFKSSTKMKRWMFLVLVGIILACYGMSKVLVSKELDLNILTLGKIIGAFVVGFSFIIIGIVFINKRNLELMIEATDDRIQSEKNVNVNSLIFNKKVYHKGPNIVVIGGGTGLDTVLEGLKDYTSNITAIVAVSDYGKETNEKTMELLPLQDIKDSIISLSEKSEEVKKLMDYKFESGKLKGTYFSDIYFSAMLDINKDFTDSIRKSNEIINMVGKVIPVTLDEMKICAELANGYVVEEKERIPEIVYDKVTSINRIYLNPSNCRPAPGVLEAIKEADSIIIGPGSLYTNVIPSLLVNGVAKAIKESNAIKIYVSNIMTEPGQTDNYTLGEHINALLDHCGEGIIDYCIYDSGEVVPEFIKKYNMEGQDLVNQNIDDVRYKGITYVQRNLSKIADEHIRHNPVLVAASIIEIICDDLKYQDKQNDPNYMMMNTKLKSDKRIEKIKKNAKKSGNKEKTKKKKGNSKFTNKYSDRIASIKEADEKFNGIGKRESKRVITIKEEIPKELREEQKNKKTEKQSKNKNTKTDIKKDIIDKKKSKTEKKIDEDKKNKYKKEDEAVQNSEKEFSKRKSRIEETLIMAKKMQEEQQAKNKKTKEIKNEENKEEKTPNLDEIETKTVDQIRKEMLERLQNTKWNN